MINTKSLSFCRRPLLLVTAVTLTLIEAPDDPDSPCAIEDPERLELQRKEMGLPPMSDYLKLMKEA
jgi:hypothetical protein